ncbi:MAG: hypothetical protein F6J98_01840 [Moorea sp. SIO4G2]|nr:hypothetical protein [Moorena sp. SIO4G2]
MTIPKVTDKSVEELVEIGRQVAIAKTSGKLRMPPFSPATVIIEAMATIAVQLQGYMNEVASEIEKNRLAIFGFTRSKGNKAVGRVLVTLNALYPDITNIEPGRELRIGGIDYISETDPSIRAGESTGIMDIIALDPGELGNQPVGSVVDFTKEGLERIESLSLLGDISGGTEPETDEQWRETIFRSLRVRALVSQEDFETETTEHLGRGSAAVAIARLKPDRITSDNGYVHVFAINANLVPLNAAQIVDLQAVLNQKAAMALISVSQIDIVTITVDVIASYTGNPKAIAQDIKRLMMNYFLPSKRSPGEMILNKSVEYLIQQIEGIKEGLVTVLIDKLEQPKQLPSQWSLAKLGSLNISLIDDRMNTYRDNSYPE